MQSLLKPWDHHGIILRCFLGVQLSCDVALKCIGDIYSAQKVGVRCSNMLQTSLNGNNHNEMNAHVVTLKYLVKCRNDYYYFICIYGYHSVLHLLSPHGSEKVLFT